jgi:hypothetical protein
MAMPNTIFVGAGTIVAITVGIIATIGDCTSRSINGTAPGHAPVLRLCRRLIEAGAKLAVDEIRPLRLVRYRMQEGALLELRLPYLPVATWRHGWPSAPKIATRGALQYTRTSHPAGCQLSPQTVHRLHDRFPERLARGFRVQPDWSPHVNKAARLVQQSCYRC